MPGLPAGPAGSLMGSVADGGRVVARVMVAGVAAGAVMGSAVVALGTGMLSVAYLLQGTWPMAVLLLTVAAAAFGPVLAAGWWAMRRPVVRAARRR
ncbi:hypothetical protein DFJ69_1337 [Thermomonospora umbrina]|uniref:Uncharacterized protein n=2 Tax=Thermomonospora umbrina TaxID=111806 RepID=A0A3D9SPN0_9ACTN|nr:hypothetical protein DFJ69_1337 [Thermomonospora umbrina]